MNSYIIYSKQSGQIEKTGVCPDKKTIIMQLEENQEFLIGSGSDSDYYVDLNDLSVRDKQSNPTTLSGNTLSNLPLPCTVSIRGLSYKSIRVESKSTINLYSDIAGKHKITVKPDNPKYHSANFRAYLEPEK